MFYVLQNESTAALRRVPILLTDAATGTTAQSGVALTNIYPYVNINGGAFIGGTGSVGEAGFGQYYYQMEPNEVSTLGLAGIHITASGCRDYDAIAQVALFNVYSSGGVGITAGDVWNYVLSDANTAEQDLVSAASGGAGISAADVWNYDYLSSVIPNSAAERLEDARTYAFNAEGNTQDIKTQVWQTDPISYGLPLTGDYFSAYLYQLGTGTTGYPSGGGGGITAGDVWSYVLADTNTAEADLISAASGGAGLTVGDVAGAVWNAQLTNYASPGTGEVFGTDTFGQKIQRTLVINRPLNTDVSNRANAVVAAINANAITATSIQSGAITSAKFATGAIDANAIATDAITSAELSASAIQEIADGVWTGAISPTRTITGGTITTVSDKTGYSLSGTQSFNLTGNITGSLSGSVGSVTGNVGGNVTGSVGSVAGNVSGNVVGSVTSVTNPVSITTADMASIASSTWNSLTASYSSNGTFGKNILRADAANKTGDVTLYSSGGVNGVDADIHRIANDTAAATSLKNILTGISGETLTANITGNLSGSVNSVTQPVTLSTATQASIANSVWLTDVSVYSAPSAGEDLATAGAGGISPNDVWTYANRTITGGIADTVTTVTNATNVTNPVSVSSASMTGIAGTVWSYPTRTLTAAVSAATNIINGPYRLTSNQNNNDGILDILQNSVQDINLNLIDGNNAPASIAGYTAVVNFFNEAGTAVTSYTPTVAYADGGIINFELDTAVTATIGRYNMIVNISGAGSIIKYGPLTTLVRPL